MSFRRQMYIHPEDVSEIPESIQINFDETAYWIYFSSDKINCFLCKEEGHLAKHCRNYNQNYNNQPVLSDIDSPASLSQDQFNLTPMVNPEIIDNPSSQPILLNQMLTNPSNSSFKRPFSDSSQANSTKH